MPTGNVKWFNGSKGFGCISLEGGAVLFVHSGAIAVSGSKRLAEGEPVEFGVTRGTKGLQAANVRRMIV